MHYSDWEPIYERIRADFEYDRDADEYARDVLEAYASPFDVDRLDVAGRTVAIAGGASTLDAEIDVADDADRVFAASTATDVLHGADVAVDLMVTDLDKNAETAIALSNAGRPVAVHAHGDNVPLVHDVVPRMDAENVLATTQVAPIGSVYNFGGFTDGDRAAFIADHLGADRLVFPGWDFDDRTVDPTKQKKLRWAKRLLALLETRREEHFDVLDGHRSAIEPL